MTPNDNLRFGAAFVLGGVVALAGRSLLQFVALRRAGSNHDPALPDAAEAKAAKPRGKRTEADARTAADAQLTAAQPPEANANGTAKPKRKSKAAGSNTAAKKRTAKSTKRRNAPSAEAAAD